MNQYPALSDSLIVLVGRLVRVKVMFPEALYNKCADFASYNAEIIHLCINLNHIVDYISLKCTNTH